MAKRRGESNPRRSHLHRSESRRASVHLVVPDFDALESRRLLAIVINEFGGTATLTTPVGITKGPDGNLWFTESNEHGVAAIGRITPSGAITTFSVGLSSGSSPESITTGPDGALWFTDPGSNQIGTITTDGTMVEYNLPTSGSSPDQIVSGPDGALWFTETGINAIGRITTAGVVTQDFIPTARSSPVGITDGPDGALWFTESASGKIGRLTTGGTFSEFPTGAVAGTGDPDGITTGPDGNLWFTEPDANQIGRITPSGTVTDFSVGITQGGGPLAITTGPDQNLWFTETNGSRVGSITATGFVSEHSVPGSPTANISSITSGVDGNLWFTDQTNGKVDRLTTAGTATQFPSTTNVLSPAAQLTGITAGPDGALWFTETQQNKLGRITTSGAISEYPSGGSTSSTPEQITLGPVPSAGGEANLWYTEDGGTDGGSVGEMSAQGTVVGQFPLPNSGSFPQGITLGPDDNIWFTEIGNPGLPAAIGQITPAGQITEFRSGLTAGFTPYYITAGPDGNLWFTASSSTGGEIGRITTKGVITQFPITDDPGFRSNPGGIVAGPGNALWFTDSGNHAIGEITTSGVITEFTTGLTSSDVPDQIAVGADGNLWFTDPSDISDPVGRITPQGAISLFQTPTPAAGPIGITAGPDQNLWFTEQSANQIGQVVLSNSIITPTPTPETVYATVAGTYQLATFFDNSAATNAANFSATIDYGDGVSGTGQILPVNGSPGEFQIIGSHIYIKPGIYTATITIGNDTGTLIPITTTVTANSPIQLTGQPINGQVGIRSNTLEASFTDADNSADPSDFTATVTWGDGSSPSTATVLDPSVPVRTFNIFAGHVYTASGTYNGTVTLVDNRNGLTATTTFTATIATVPTPTIFNELGPAGLSPGSEPTNITTGPDGALWFTEPNTGAIGRMDTSGNVAQYFIGNINADPDVITTGPDGNLWFTEPGTNEIGRITPAGAITNFSTGITAGSEPTGLTSGPNGALWFTEQAGNRIGEITTSGTVTEFSSPSIAGLEPDAITTGPSQNLLWFVGVGSNLIGSINSLGTITVHTGATGSDLTSILTANDGNLWFTETGSNQIGKINPTTFAVTEYSGTAISSPKSLTIGPDGNLWFTAVLNGGTPEIGDITTAGVSSGYSAGLTLNSNPQGIVQGPDSILYFTETAGDRIGQVVFPRYSVSSITPTNLTLYQGEVFNGNIGTFVEKSTIPTSANFQVDISWGDNSPVQTVQVSGGNGQFSIPATHPYTASGSYLGELQIFNATGVQTSFFSVSVSPAIVATGVDVSTEAGRTVAIPVAYFTDAGGTRPANQYQLTINWGDGTSSTGTLGAYTNGDPDVLGTHKYSETGDYQISTVVQLTADPEISSTAISQAVVTPFVSVLSSTGNSIFQTVGSPFSGIVAHFVDSSSATSSGNLADYSAFITWGDNQSPPTPGQIIIAPGAQGYEVIGSHDFTAAGDYNVQVVISKIGAIDTTTTIDAAQVEVTGPIEEVEASLGGTPTSITEGPDGALWFTEPGLAAVGRITTGGVVTEFTAGINPAGPPVTITSGPDGNLWFTQPNSYEIGRITPSGVVTEFTLSNSIASEPYGITAGPDGNLWFTDERGPNSIGAIGRITPQGVVTYFQQGLGSGSSPQAITLGPDGNLWFVDDNFGLKAIGRITPQGVITEFNFNTDSTSLSSISSGPDGNLWFTEDNPGVIGRITTQGVITQSSAGLLSGSEPNGITEGPDNNLWFVDTYTNQVDRLTTSDVITPFTIPTTNSQPLDIVTGSDENLWFTESSADQIGQVVMPQAVTSTSETQTVPQEQTVNVPEVTYHDNSSLVDLSRFFSTAINFGDGQTGTGTLVTDGLGGFSFISSHSYASSGSFSGSTVLSNAIGSTPQAPFQIVVNPAETLSFVVTNTNDSGPGSLRQVILNADQVGGHTITFQIPTAKGAVATIVPQTPLPTITGPAFVDGLTEGVSSLYAPRVEIDGRNLGANTPGMVFGDNSTGSELLDVSIFDFLGPQVVIDSNYASIYGSYLGISSDGNETNLSASTLPATLGSDGLLIEGGSATIGGLVANQGNVISGNLGQGIELVGLVASGSIVAGNLIGTDTTGTKSIPNRINGITADSGAGYLMIGPSNVISGNGNIGVDLLTSSGNLIVGNTIGLAFGNEKVLGNANAGVSIDLGSTRNSIGGPVGPATNMISGNGAVGITIQGGSYANSILGNRIGTDQPGVTGLGNGIAGILISDAPDNFVGLGNLISGNGTISQGAGVWIEGAAATGNVVQGNLIGTDYSGVRAIGNSIIGVLINDAPFNTVGGNSPNQANQISGNSEIGVMIAGAGSVGNLVAGNLIGTDYLGRNAISNGTGVYLDAAPGNFIGGSLAGFGNVISGNSSDGLQIFAAGSTGNLIQGNKIGTDWTGTKALDNGGNGLLVNGAPRTRIVANLLDSNSQNGIFVSGSASPGTLIQSNSIGRGQGGQPLGNAYFGLLIGNGAPNPTQIGNVVENNIEGPIRNTNLAPAQSATTTIKAKTVSTKVQVKAQSFGGRSLTSLQSRGRLKLKA